MSGLVIDNFLFPTRPRPVVMFLLVDQSKESEHENFPSATRLIKFRGCVIKTFVIIDVGRVTRDLT